MSDQNPFVKLIKKSVGLPAGKSGCCGGVASQETVNQSGGSAALKDLQDNTNQCDEEQRADTLSGCDSKESDNIRN